MGSDATNKGALGPQIGKYKVIEHIATGGMGAVYKAVDVNLNRVVALKVLSPEMAKNKPMLVRFQREARSAATLRHENIVAIYEYNEDKDLHFLALEYVDGNDLHDIINKRGKLPVEEAREIALQAAHALDHAYRAKIVHRDIKPSNFLIADKDGKLQVKLTDLGLARQVENEEFQVTKAGTTVGTVDYMSPEQARDSRRADTRSDIYSLGCTLYHMLAGAAPFAQGSLTERIYKHIEMKPPDIKQFNAEVPAYMVGILERMLAKKPDDRYQTPADLIADLESRTGPRSTEIEETPTPVKKGKSRPPAKKPPSKAKKLKAVSEAPARRKVKRKKLPRWWPIAAGIAGAALVALAIWPFVGSQAIDNSQAIDKPAPPPPVIVEVKPKDEVVVPPVGIEPAPIEVENVVLMGPEPPRYKPLYKPTNPIDAERQQSLWQEVAGWTAGFCPEAAAATTALTLSPAGPLLTACSLHPERDSFNGFPRPRADAVVMQVNRFAEPKKGHRTLAEALAAVPAGKQAVIELNDNGPIFVSALPELVDRHIWLRAAPGYRPLLAWNVDGMKLAESRSLLAAAGGKLVLENLDIVVKTPDGATESSFNIVRVADGDFFVRRCTISSTGGTPVNFVQATGAPMSVTRAMAPIKCCLSEVYARGSNLTAISSNGVAVDAFLQHCLTVGGDRPMFDLVGQDINIHASMLRMFRSTLIATKSILRVQNQAGQTNAPRLRCLMWDTMLSCASTRPDSALIVVGNGGRPDNLGWRPTNTLYVGWKNLLESGTSKLAGSELAAWQSLSLYSEGDVNLPLENWPSTLPARVHEAAASVFDPHGAVAAFAATSGHGTLGVDVGRLPPAPAHWRERTFVPFSLPPVAMLEGSGPPIPNAEIDNLYHGESIDLMQANLGLVLQQRLLEKKDVLGPKLVFYLTGSGERPTAPVRISGVKDVVICADQPPAGNLPLVLVPDPATTADSAALIQVEGGNLDLVGVNIRIANSKTTLSPGHAVQVGEGGLRLARCWLRGPTTQPPASFQSLLSVRHSFGAPANVAINECILVAGKKLVDIHGGVARIGVRQSVLVAIGDGLAIDASPTYLASIDLHCHFDSSTLAFGKSLLTFSWHGDGQRLEDPFVVNCTRCVFTDPFLMQPKQSTLLTTDRATFCRGLIRWHGAGNAFDKRCGPLLTVAGEKVATLEDWERLWGPGVEQRPLPMELPDNKRYDLNPEEPELDHLILPSTLRRPAGEPLPGADLGVLGIFRRKTG